MQGLRSYTVCCGSCLSHQRMIPKRGRLGLRSLLFAGLLATVWLMGAEQADAQYKHFGLGFVAGIQNTFNQVGDPKAEPVGSRYNLGYGVGFSYISLGVEGSWRFEDRWAVSAETHFSFHSCATPNRDAKQEPRTVCSKDHLSPIMLFVNVLIRHFFITDEFRPYIDIGIGYWQSLALVNASVSAFGPTATLGFEYFFQEELSLGIRVRYGMQVVVEETQLSVFHQIMAVATFNAYI
ncbi:MAG: hypothetical protein EP343_20640 [Deltaproteobacteria bacterium]|nr:MAG: hypothetical protein EP343_20640 [Deltaproteobacteria bacterium]